MDPRKPPEHVIDVFADPASVKDVLKGGRITPDSALDMILCAAKPQIWHLLRASGLCKKTAGIHAFEEKNIYILLRNSYHPVAPC
ncbi:conserved hypothetical protein, partial [Coccidioides posadasii str. Silveira]